MKLFEASKITLIVFMHLPISNILIAKQLFKKEAVASRQDIIFRLGQRTIQKNFLMLPICTVRKMMNDIRRSNSRCRMN